VCSNFGLLDNEGEIRPGNEKEDSSRGETSFFVELKRGSV
jgi:hypothetical protein